jgi:hypothetical protein
LDGSLAILPSSCETGALKSGTVTFQVGTMDPSGNILKPGITLTITLHTTGGKNYNASVVLPEEYIEIKNAYVTKSGSDYIVNLSYVNTGLGPTSIDSRSKKAYRARPEILGAFAYRHVWG